MPKVTIKSLSDLTPDNNNANRHTVRGTHLLRTSVEKFGPSRDAMLLDKYGNIVGGNARAETFADKGMTDIQVIEGLDPSKPVALQYEDLDLTDPDNNARSLSVALNRTAELNISFDYEVLENYRENGVEITDFFFEEELQRGLNKQGDTPNNVDDVWVGMPEFEQEDKMGVSVIVRFANDNDKIEFFNFIGQTGASTTKSIWYPKRPDELTDQLGTKEGLVYT